MENNLDGLVYRPQPAPALAEPASAAIPVRIEIQAQPKRTVQVVLVAEDFTPGEVPLVGLSATCRVDFPMGVRKKLIGLVSAGRGVQSDKANVQAQLDALETAQSAIVSIAQEWNIDNGGIPMPVSVESLDALPDAVFNGVSKLVGKALGQSTLDPNSAGS